MEQWRKALEVEPHFLPAVAHSAIWIAYLRSPEFAGVMRELRKRPSIDDPMELAALGASYIASGDTAQGRNILSGLTAMSKRRYVCPYEMATAHAILGDKDEAIACLTVAYRERSTCIPDIKTDPRLDSLRTDTRFQALVRNVGFPP